MPEGLKGKREYGIIDELEEMYETESANSFICKAFRALMYELEVVRGFKVTFKPSILFFNISWDLSSAKNTQ